MITKETIKQASLEAIYWWNRTESLNHNRFKRLDLLLDIDKYKKVVVEKTIKPFLSEYSVRRNLAKGDQNIINFLNKIVEEEFIKEVKKGNIDIIDNISEKFTSEQFTNNRNTVSLLSKMAFLINPMEFVLYDSLAKKSLRLLLIARKQSFISKNLNCYSEFYKYIKIIKDEINDADLFESAKEILFVFKETPAYSFFSSNEQTFQLRIVDKLLWLMQQPNIDNTELIEIYNKYGV